MKNKIRLIVIISIIFCVVSLLLALIRYRYFFHDDEMISLRYAGNFLNQKGLNWNPGERIEGYTSFLHLLLSSFVIWLTGDFLLAPRIVNFAFGALIVFFAWRLFKRRYPCPDEIRLLSFTNFLLIVVPYPGIVIWIYGGLETVTYTSILFIALCIFLYFPKTIRNSIWAGLLFGLAAMTRPDGILFFAVCVGFLLGVSLKDKKWNLFFAFVISFLVVFGSYFLCRYNYYGLLFPNTFYAKTNFTLSKIHIGLIYTISFAVSIAFVLAAIVFLLMQNKVTGLLHTNVLLLLSSIFIYLCYIIMYGGDHMPAFRFLIPLLPIIAMLLAELTRRLPAKTIVIATVLLITNTVFVYVYDPIEISEAEETDTAAYNGAIVGNYLNSLLPKDQLIATNSAGAIPFFGSDHRFIDMLGICDTTISHRNNFPMLAPWQYVPGHEKGDGNYILSRHPDIIILGPSEGTVNTVWFLSDAEILLNQSFKKEYKMQQVKLPGNDIRLHSAVGFRHKPAIDSLIFTYYTRIADR